MGTLLCCSTIKTVVVKYRRRGNNKGAALVFRPRASTFALLFAERCGGLFTTSYTDVLRHKRLTTSRYYYISHPFPARLGYVARSRDLKLSSGGHYPFSLGKMLSSAIILPSIEVTKCQKYLPCAIRCHSNNE